MVGGCVCVVGGCVVCGSVCVCLVGMVVCAYVWGDMFCVLSIAWPPFLS